MNGNPPGILKGTRPAPGPDGKPKGSTYFPGRSVGIFPIKQNQIRKLNQAEGITFTSWIKPKRFASGIIIRFGLDFGLKRGHLYASFRPLPNVRYSRPPQVASRISIPHNKWSYVAVTYSKKKKTATLYQNSKPIARRVKLPVLLGGYKKVNIGKGFRGSISCVQMYRYDLTSRQLKKKKKRCFRGRKLCFFYYYLLTKSL